MTATLFSFQLTGCNTKGDENNSDEDQLEIRSDGSYKLRIPLGGSLQNPAFSPDGQWILLTNFKNGYNQEPADIIMFNLESRTLKTLVSDGSANVNLPGSCWNFLTRAIVFSSSRDPHDEIFWIGENGKPGDEVRITNRTKKMAYEPSLSPEGQTIVFESHLLDVEGNGVIVKYQLDGSAPYWDLTRATDDCRQPNWSPANNLIVYQKGQSDQWDLWVMNPDGSGKRQITSGSGDKTDASFSPDAQWIIFSANINPENANIFKISISGSGSTERITNFSGYDGAPSISPDGKKIAFESCPGDPDESSGTSIWMMERK